MNQEILKLARQINQELNRKAKALKLDANILRIRYALERFLYRLSLSEHSHHYTLKGALLFLLWNQLTCRPTKDADFLFEGPLDGTEIGRQIQSICNIDQASIDGMIYDPESVSIAPIRELHAYKGSRITLDATLGTIHVPIQLDIGVGDIVTPTPSIVSFTRLLETLPPARINVYPPETVVAEKLEAMVSLDLANSRMKDFFDVWMILTQIGFDPSALKTAIQATFRRRETPLPEKTIPALTPYFYEDKEKLKQWNAFIRKSGISYEVPALAVVCEEISNTVAFALRD